MSNKALPEGWIETKVGKIVEFEYGKGLPKKSRNENGNIPVYGSNGRVGYHDIYLVEGPVLIVGRKGTAGEVCYSEKNCWPIDTTYFVRVSNCLNFKFTYYLLKSLKLKQYDKSTAIPGLNRNDAYVIDIQLPPLPEQHAIAAKLEELFSDLDNGVASLKQAQAQLKTYRQTVLKYAFEGKLTAEWRTQQRPAPAADLLRQIQAERAAHYQWQIEEWQQVCAQAKAAGTKKPPKPKKPKDLPPLTAAELADLPELPEGWCWVSLGNLASTIQIGPFGTQLYKSDYIEDGIPVINPMHIEDLKVEANRSFSIRPEKLNELPNYVLDENDIIMGRRGEMGRCAVITENEQGWLCGTGSLFIRLVEVLNAKFYCSILSSQRIKSYLENASIGTTMQNLNLNILNNIPVQVCSIEEQHQIVQEIETRLSICEQLEQSIAASLRKAESLRQSLLKHAFEGKLSAPWRARHPDLISGEHSAAALLEKIKEERDV